MNPELYDKIKVKRSLHNKAFPNMKIIPLVASCNHYINKGKSEFALDMQMGLLERIVFLLKTPWLLFTHRKVGFSEFKRLWKNKWEGKDKPTVLIGNDDPRFKELFGEKEDK